MDKKSEQTKDAKECGDVDIGVHKYGIGNYREQLNGLWGVVGEEVVGMPPERLMDNCYRKMEARHDKSKPDLVEEIMERGPPIMNISRPRRVF